MLIRSAAEAKLRDADRLECEAGNAIMWAGGPQCLRRPTWLANAHADLDQAVAGAYGWPTDISDDDAIAKLFELNQSRAAISKSFFQRGVDDR